jgi:hypothetical protein
MSFSLSFRPALLGPTGAHWLDDPSDLTSKESMRQHALDDPLLSTDLAVEGRVPSAAAITARLDLSAGRSAGRAYGVSNRNPDSSWVTCWATWSNCCGGVRK